MSAKSDEMSATVGRKVVNGPKVLKDKKTRKKTEPANPFGQFLREKRANDGKFVHKLACEEWRNLGEDKREHYRKLFEEEKAAMGDGYRAKKVRGGNPEKEKSVRKKRGMKVKQSVTGEAPLNYLQLLSKLQSLDNELEMMHLEARHLQELLCNEKVQFETSQMRKEEKIKECESIRDKYKTLMSQHSSCQAKQ